MASREPVSIDFGAGPRQLRYSITATRKLKQRFGSIKEMMTVEAFEALPDAIYEGLIDKTDLSPEKIADMIDLQDVQRLHYIFLRALTGVDIEEKLAEAEAESKEKNEQAVTIGSALSTSIGSGASDTAS